MVRLFKQHFVPVALPVLPVVSVPLMHRNVVLSQGAKVKLECRHFTNGKVEHTVEGVTDINGVYKIQSNDSHKNEICEVALIYRKLDQGLCSDGPWPQPCMHCALR
ncbi:LLP-B3 protein [Carex littledalei]|uniref:LLP-B3 protein n=1 Tax=Carex littledalei TaxID=544730 RepID=A0A833VV25_9POAL|nr:LLP-B3 protein [Carex littledalei]